MNLLCSDGLYIEARDSDEVSYKLVPADRLFAYWNYPTKIRGPVTLRDLCTIIKTMPDAHRHVLGMICGCKIDLMIDECFNGKRPKDKNVHILLTALGDVSCEDDSQHRKFGMFDRFYFNRHIDVSGEDVNDFKKKWAIEFCGLDALSECQIRIDYTFKIHTIEVLPIDSFSFKLVSLTLGEIITSIFWELGWHGSPDDRDKVRNDILDSVNELDRDGQLELPLGK